MQGERPIRGRRLALAAVSGAFVALVAAAQPVAGLPNAGSDSLHANLERRLPKLERDERTGVVVQLDAPATDERSPSPTASRS